MTSTEGSAEEDDRPTVYVIRYSERALRDIDEVLSWLKDNVSEEAAVEWRDGFFTRVSILSTFPMGHPAAPEASRFARPVRHLLYRRLSSASGHRVLFTLSSPIGEPPTVTILHVRHTSRRPITKAEARTIEAQAES
jgi:plasmid stabilization system protein ParE